MTTFKFMKDYREKIAEYTKKAEDLKKEIVKLRGTKEELDRKYSVYIGKLDFEGASKLKQKAKDTEVELETKEDILELLRNKIQNGDEEQAIQAAKGYKQFKEEHAKQIPGLIKEADKKRREYLTVLQKIDDYNSHLNHANSQIRRLDKVAKWNNPGVIKEVGFTLLSEHGSDIQIKVADYFIQNHDDIRSFY